MRDVLRAGADKVSLNTAAVADPTLITACAGRFGRQAVVVAIDARRPRAEAGPDPAGRSSSRAAANRPASTRSPGRERVVELGAGELLVTSIDRDGTGSGFDTALLRAITSRVGVPVIASGGAAGPDDFVAAVRRRRRRRGPRSIDLPPPDPFDRGRQGRDGRRRASGAPRPTGGRRDARPRRSTRRPSGSPPTASSRRSSRTSPTDGSSCWPTWTTRRWPRRSRPARSTSIRGRAADCGGRARRAATSCAWSTSRSTATATPSWSPSIQPGRRATAARGAASTPTARPIQRRPGLRVARDAVGDDRRSRAAERPEGSYTTSLLDGGVDAVGRKVTEEATEVLLAAKDDAAAEAAGDRPARQRDALAGETADLAVPHARAARRARPAARRGHRRPPGPPPLTRTA